MRAVQETSETTHHSALIVPEYPGLKLKTRAEMSVLLRSKEPAIRDRVMIFIN